MKPHRATISLQNILYWRFKIQFVYKQQTQEKIANSNRYFDFEIKHFYYCTFGLINRDVSHKDLIKINLKLILIGAECK